jgi:protein-S-isoprenylcysteine O-methyltransferase Ste14
VLGAGLLLAAVGAALALRSGLLLAGRGRPRRGPQPAFVLAGPYLRIRNPLLVGSLLAVVGSALAAGSGRSAVAAALLGAGAAHLWVVRVEEPRLRARFGAAYEEYCRRIPRWLPRFERARGGR